MHRADRLRQTQLRITPRLRNESCDGGTGVPPVQPGGDARRSTSKLGSVAALGTIVGCQSLLVAHLPVTPRSTPAPGSITISRKLKPGRISFQDTRLLWMIPNLRPSARRLACRTSATS